MSKLIQSRPFRVEFVGNFRAQNPVPLTSPKTPKNHQKQPKTILPKIPKSCILTIYLFRTDRRCFGFPRRLFFNTSNDSDGCSFIFFFFDPFQASRLGPSCRAPIFRPVWWDRHLWGWSGGGLGVDLK